MSKNIYLAVTNDLTTDQRLDNVANTLLKNNYNVTVIGIKKSHLHKKHYTTKRFLMLFKSGKMFHVEYSIRLFLYLLFSKIDVIVANNLDTVVPCFWASKLKKNQLVFDSRNLFTELPEICTKSKRSAKKNWERIEKKYLPRIKFNYSVSDTISELFSKKYETEYKTILNIPQLSENVESADEVINLKEKYNAQRVILYQGKLAQNKGVEYMIKAIQHIDDAVLVIIGSGYMKEQLVDMVNTLKLTKKVFFIDKQPYETIHLYTRQADLGVSLEEYTSESYKSTISTKVFNYINNDIPVIVSNLPEMTKVVESYKIGIVSESYHPLILANKINKVFNNPKILEDYKKNIKKAKADLNWEKEETKLVDLFNSVG
jgi:glycosyltransferase involved in cell wall biosynthesis